MPSLRLGHHGNCIAKEVFKAFERNLRTLQLISRMIDIDDKQQRMPDYKKGSFVCPYCGVYAFQARSRRRLYSNPDLCGTRCVACKQGSLWLLDKDEGEMVMVYPDKGIGPSLPSEAGDDVRKLYDEANSIVTRSPRAASALLRSALEVLCKKILGKTAKGDLKSMITKIAKEHNFNAQAIKAMDNVRLTGNRAIHPGQIELQDNTKPEVLFELLWYIVQQAISQHQTAERLNKLAQAGLTGSSDNKKDAEGK